MLIEIPLLLLKLIESSVVDKLKCSIFCLPWTELDFANARNDVDKLAAIPY
jgi:hypothetical protein